MPDAITPSPIDIEIEKLKSNISKQEAESASLSQSAEKLRSNLSELERLSGELSEALAAYQTSLAASRVRYDELQSFLESSTKMIGLDDSQKADIQTKVNEIKKRLDQPVEELKLARENFEEANKAWIKAKETHETAVEKYRKLQIYQTEQTALLDDGENLKQQIEKEKNTRKKYFLIRNVLKEELLDKLKIPSTDDYSKQLQDAWLAVKSGKEDLLKTDEQRTRLTKELTEHQSLVNARTESLPSDILRELEQPVTRNEKA